VVAVVGTATEVGKTWVTASLARSGGGRRVAARKPAQSYDAPPTDADVLAEATGEDPATICPRSYPVALAPPMAAEVLGLPVPTLDDLLGELTWPEDVDVGFVETAGGVRSPIAGDGDCADYVRRLAPDLVLLVADAGLGVINAVRLSAAALDGLPVVVWLNRFDPTDDLHQRNRQWLAERDGLTVVTDPDSCWRLISVP
jgi:dethiobiotin synthetase